jgi:hypothetical protein
MRLELYTFIALSLYNGFLQPYSAYSLKIVLLNGNHDNSGAEPYPVTYIIIHERTHMGKISFKSGSLNTTVICSNEYNG